MEWKWNSRCTTEKSRQHGPATSPDRRTKAGLRDPQQTPPAPWSGLSHRSSGAGRGRARPRPRSCMRVSDPNESCLLCIVFSVVRQCWESPHLKEASMYCKILPFHENPFTLKPKTIIFVCIFLQLFTLPTLNTTLRKPQWTSYQILC